MIDINIRLHSRWPVHLGTLSERPEARAFLFGIIMLLFFPARNTASVSAVAATKAYKRASIAEDRTGISAIANIVALNARAVAVRSAVTGVCVRSWLGRFP